MLQMATLEQAEPEIPARPPSAAWGIRQRILLLGSLILLFGLVLTLYLYFTGPALPTAENVRQRTQSLSPFQSWRHWHVLRASGPDPGTQFQRQQFAEKLSRRRSWIGVALAITAGGAVLITIALLKDQKRADRTRAETPRGDPYPRRT